jgi:hypothetical protein
MFRMLCVIDKFTRHCLAIVDWSPHERVARPHQRGCWDMLGTFARCDQPMASFAMPAQPLRKAPVTTTVCFVIGPSAADRYLPLIAFSAAMLVGSAMRGSRVREYKRQWF